MLTVAWNLLIHWSLRHPRELSGALSFPQVLSVPYRFSRMSLGPKFFPGLFLTGPKAFQGFHFDVKSSLVLTGIWGLVKALSEEKGSPRWTLVCEIFSISSLYPQISAEMKSSLGSHWVINIFQVLTNSLRPSTGFDFVLRPLPCSHVT